MTHHARPYRLQYTLHGLVKLMIIIMGKQGGGLVKGV
jgi:hypothetical protein